MSAPASSPGVIQEAAIWYARLRSPSLTEADRACFREWLEREPSHRNEFREIDGLWHQLEGIALSPEILAARAGRPQRSPRARISRRAMLGGALAAGIAAAGVYYGVPYLGEPETYTTDIGEIRTVSLSDGSIVTLNTASAIRARFSRWARRIELVRGQAHFEVAGNASRPFIVRAGEGEVVAVGTVFDVYQRADDVVVTLIEGRVDVEAAAGTLALSPGEQATFGTGHRMARSSADLKQVAAWRSGKLEFRDTPVAEAIAEANRYSRVRIELHDVSLAQARISGVFDAGSNEALANALCAYFGLTLQRVEHDRILLLPEPH